jgi:hypothetical protein
MSRRHIIYVAVGLAIVALATVWFIYWHGQGFLAVQTGTRCGSTGVQYCYWSGFGSVFPWVLLGSGGVLAVLYLHARHINCHQPGCWRVGRFNLAGGEFRVCGKHHPGWEGKHPTRAHLLARHHEHEARSAAALRELTEPDPVPRKGDG